jgi:HSP20 family molecular chaperone IbpA
MNNDRMKVAPNAVAYSDKENLNLIVEFQLPGAPAESIDLKILADNLYLVAPAREIEYVSSLSLGWPVKAEKATARYELGLLHVMMPFKDPMEDAVKVKIEHGGSSPKIKTIEP